MLELLAQIDGATWTSLVSNFGAPGAIFLVIIFAVYKGWFITSREAAKDKAALEFREAEWQKRYAERESEWTSRYGKMETEKNYWRDSNLKMMESLERNTNVAIRAAEKLTPSGDNITAVRK